MKHSIRKSEWNMMPNLADMAGAVKSAFPADIILEMLATDAHGQTQTLVNLNSACFLPVPSAPETVVFYRFKWTGYRKYSIFSFQSSMNKFHLDIRLDYIYYLSYNWSYQ